MRSKVGEHPRRQLQEDKKEIPSAVAPVPATDEPKLVRADTEQTAIAAPPRLPTQVRARGQPWTPEGTPKSTRGKWRPPGEM